ncbi:hypothetical protein QQ008_07580 [Fulvivirgaceae bacterium BMA10]|uniref:Uncharacterized protein n=1 Tax=Splendidivirga corallicola TaxID=3051826 RepID=A0ABT8KKH8_9BACT|nr:hypothetical protein [Fulvivirgaceae bacterium BMA10]
MTKKPNSPEPARSTGSNFFSKLGISHNLVKTFVIAVIGSVFGGSATFLGGLYGKIYFEGKKDQRLDIVYNNYEKYKDKYDNLLLIERFDSTLRNFVLEYRTNRIQDRFSNRDLHRILESRLENKMDSSHNDLQSELREVLRADLNNDLDVLKLELSTDIRSQTNSLKSDISSRTNNLKADIRNSRNLMKSDIEKFRKSFEEFKESERVHLNEFASLKDQHHVDFRFHSWKYDELNNSFILIKDDLDKLSITKSTTIDTDNSNSLDDVISYLDNLAPYDVFKAEYIDDFNIHHSQIEKDSYKRRITENRQYKYIGERTIDGVQIWWYYMSNSTPSDRLITWIGSSKMTPFIIHKGEEEFVPSRFKIEYVNKLINSNNLDLFDGLHGFDKNNNHFIICTLKNDSSRKTYCMISYLK